MSENTTPAAAGPTPGPVSSPVNGPAAAGKGDAEQRNPERDPSAEQHGETDWQAQARHWERQARSNKDAAEKLAQLEESGKSELQKLIDRAEKAERELAAKSGESLRLQVAAKHGITGDHLDLLHGTDEATLNAAAEKLAKLINGSKGPRIPNPGRSPHDQPRGNGTGDEAMRELASELFNSER